MILMLVTSALSSQMRYSPSSFSWSDIVKTYSPRTDIRKDFGGTGRSPLR
jgi:hypothetical protein